MPIFIGSEIPGATVLEPNQEEGPTLLRLTYAQALRIPTSKLLCSFMSSHTSRKYRSKQWWAWYCKPETIIGLESATNGMIAAWARHHWKYNP